MVKRDDWLVWEGPEVEGRYHGLRTTLVRQLPAGFGVMDIDTPHLYCCVGVTDPVQDRTRLWEIVKEALNRGLVVTVEVEAAWVAALPDWVRAMCHLMISFNSGGMFNLIKPTDTIRLLDAPITAATVTFNGMQVSWPDQYDGVDTPLITREDADVHD